MSYKKSGVNKLNMSFIMGNKKALRLLVDRYLDCVDDTFSAEYAVYQE